MPLGAVIVLLIIVCLQIMYIVAIDSHIEFKNLFGKVSMYTSGLQSILIVVAIVIALFNANF